MSGLPGAGKSTAAEAIARRIGAVVVPVDPIEDALHRAGLGPSFETGLAAYLAAEVVADSTLRLGLPVLIDAANYLEVARTRWRALARSCGADLTWVEVVCSDVARHRDRLTVRDRGFDPSLEPGWAQVMARRAETDPWSAADRERLVQLDTAVALEPQLLRLGDAEGPAPRWGTGPS